MAFAGHAFTHSRQLMHLFSAKSFSGFVLMLSGLWHQAQFRLQPLKNMVVLIPGPSFTEYRLMSKMQGKGFKSD
jgi:hypothetical protein